MGLLKWLSKTTFSDEVEGPAVGLHKQGVLPPKPSCLAVHLNPKLEARAELSLWRLVRGGHCPAQSRARVGTEVQVNEHCWRVRGVIKGRRGRLIGVDVTVDASTFEGDLVCHFILSVILTPT